MPEIKDVSGCVTQITTVEIQPEQCDEVLALMKERASFMSKQPGFLSVSLHRAHDGSRIVNYVQWANPDLLSAAHHAPEFREKWPRFGQLIEGAEPALYDVVQIVER